MRALAVLVGAAIVSGCAAPGVGVASADPNSPEVAKLFEQYDCDRNSLLTYEELKTAEVGVKKPEGGADAFARFYRSLMEIHDADNSGALDRAEMAKLWKTMDGVVVHIRTDGGCAK